MPRKASSLHRPAPRWRFPLLALLLMAAVAAFFLLGEQVSAFVENARTMLEGVGRGVLGTFGLGLAIIVLVLLAVLAFKGWVILLRRWHRWMGMAVLVLALFGALSFLRPQGGPLQEATLGGRLGQLIAGPSTGLGVARVALLAYLGLLLVGPATTWAWTRGFLRVIWRALALGGRGARAFLMLLAKAALILLKALVWPVKAVLPKAKGAPAAGAPARPAALRGATPSTAPPAARGTYPQFEEAYAPPEEAPPPPQPREDKPAKPVITPSGWELPPLDLLEPTTETTIVAADAERRAEVLQKALSEYGVEARVVGWNPGPTVTQFEVEPGWDIKYKETKEKDANGEVRTSRQEVARTRVKVDRIKALDNDLALALAAPSIRIEAPVPGKPIVGIEVPNAVLRVVPLGAVVESPQFQRLRTRTKLALALGKGVGGEPLVADLGRMPHLLIAGATGSGKSVCINSFICGLALYNTPEDLKMVLIDPKRVEFVPYHVLPHLVMPVVVDREKAVEALRWLAQEMDSRYKVLSAAGARNIEEYNRTSRLGGPLPYLVLFVDELADLMTVAFEETEKNLCRLAQLARATGIHLVVATQRPSVDVVTGLIKANFPTRISFALSSQVDSRTILDTAGAEKLLGRGDMLYLPTDAPRPKRLQGCFVSDAEIERIVAFWRRQRRPAPAPPPPATAPHTAPGEVAPQAPQPPADPLLEAARRLAKEQRQISANFLQRRLQIGASRAVKLMELLEAEGIVGGDKKTESKE